MGGEVRHERDPRRTHLQEDGPGRAPPSHPPRRRPRAPGEGATNTEAKVPCPKVHMDGERSAHQDGMATADAAFSIAVVTITAMPRSLRSLSGGHHRRAR